MGLNTFNSDYHRYGYQIISSALDITYMKSVECAIEGLLDQALKSLESNVNNLTLDEKWLMLKQKSPILKSKVYDLVKALNIVQSVSATPLLGQFLNNIFGEVYFVDKAQIRFDDTQNDRLLPLHQEVYGQINYRSLNIWIPFMDVDQGSGGLSVVPGSHKLGLLPHIFCENYGGAHGVKDGCFDSSKIVTLKVRAGDAVVFDPLLIHGSSNNNSQKMRKTFVARISSVESIPCLSEESLPLFIPQVSSQ